MTDIVLAKHSGFCFGVKRAVDTLEEVLENNTSGKQIFCLGEIIHNKTFSDSIKQRGVKVISQEDISDLPKGCVVVVRTHGVQAFVYEMLLAKDIEVIDATCPYVRKAHNIVKNHSANPEADPMVAPTVVIIGDPEHPEVIGIKSFAKGDAYVFSSYAKLESFFSDPQNKGDIKNPLLVAQTTFNTQEWDKCQKFIKSLYTNALIFDTICSVTDLRQQEVKELSEKSDLVVVVGGKTSSNTAKLYGIAREHAKNSLYIETARDLKSLPADFYKEVKTIAIAAGASTPEAIIQEVYQTMTETKNNDLGFEEMLDESFKTLSTGERAVGTISSVSPAEIHVDLGIKYTGILPYDEATSDTDVNLEEEFKVGDQIEVICVKFNDNEGTVMLSKKRLDQTKHWSLIEAAHEEDTILTGTVTHILRGGVLVTTKSMKVFIPASHCGIPRSADLEQLKGQTVNYKVIETNEQRRRAVGSIRFANREKREGEREEFFASLNEGDKFTGTVRSLTNYGAFVNIGPMDGMVHITELSWGRLKPPAELFQVGDSIDVYIKSLNPENKRISLGYKTEANNPWNIFGNTYKVEDVVTATVVSLMPFGAFAEIIPGVDGLIHNTHIARKPVGNPASVLKLGDKVTAKIIAIDLERNRVSLSIKALLDELGPDESIDKFIESAEKPTKEVAETVTEEVVETVKEETTEVAETTVVAETTEVVREEVVEVVEEAAETVVEETTESVEEVVETVVEETTEEETTEVAETTDVVREEVVEVVEEAAETVAEETTEEETTEVAETTVVVQEEAVEESSE